MDLKCLNEPTGPERNSKPRSFMCCDVEEKLLYFTERESDHFRQCWPLRRRRTWTMRRWASEGPSHSELKAGGEHGHKGTCRGSSCRMCSPAEGSGKKQFIHWQLLDYVSWSAAAFYEYASTQSCLYLSSSHWDGRLGSQCIIWPLLPLCCRETWSRSALPPWPSPRDRLCSVCCDFQLSSVYSEHTTRQQEPGGKSRDLILVFGSIEKQKLCFLESRNESVTREATPTEHESTGPRSRDTRILLILELQGLIFSAFGK